MYASVTTGHRGGGYNLVFFSNTATYEPEELTAFELGTKHNGSITRCSSTALSTIYDYENVHTVATEASHTYFGTSTSVLGSSGS